MKVLKSTESHGKASLAALGNDIHHLSFWNLTYLVFHFPFSIIPVPMLDLGRLRQGPEILEVNPSKDLYAIYLR
jgi:hypothetical protein